jgi:glycosyltransferase involved in cell wall biosynthesis
MLAGGGPIITTGTGGTLEAVGDTAVIIEPGDVAGLAAAVDRVVLDMSAAERQDRERRARARAMSFDRAAVFDSLFPQEAPTAWVTPGEVLQGHDVGG